MSKVLHLNFFFISNELVTTLYYNNDNGPIRINKILLKWQWIISTSYMNIYYVGLLLLIEAY